LRPTVIAVCGSSSGAGKSTLVRRLSEVIPNSTSLFFDAYHETTSYPPNLYKDLAEGKNVDPSLIQSPIFYQDLVSLVEEREVIDPWNRRLRPAKYILVEEPFGKLRTGMREIIHYLIGVEIPLDMALARRILRNISKRQTAPTMRT
jgi:uridine kinase